jgi:hypothetical protein
MYPYVDALHFSVYIYIRCLVSFSLHGYENQRTGKHVKLSVL